MIGDFGTKPATEQLHGLVRPGIDRPGIDQQPVPKFRKERDERELWSTHDTTDYFDFSKNRVEIEFDRGIEAPVKSISLRLPREMLNQLKVLANK